MDNIDFNLLNEKDNESVDFSKRYLSKNGFETIEIKRGFTEIKKLYDIVYQTGHSFICGGYVRYMASKNENEVLVDADFLHDEEKGMLRIKNIHCPVSSTIRCVKYRKKGYYLTPVEAMRLFIDWDNRDDEYRSKLYDFIKIMSQNGEMTQQQLDEFEAMLRID